jgi:putative transposase
MVFHKCQYHITFIPKYRKRINDHKIKETIYESIINKSKKLNIVIKNIQIMDDHVHIFISINATDNVSYIIGQLKGYSSYMVNKYTKSHNKQFWGKGYYCESIGNISESTIIKYIDNQYK